MSLSPFLDQCKRQVRIVVRVFKIPSEVTEGEIRLSTAHPPSGEAYTLAIVHRTLLPLQLSYKPSYMFLHLTSVETATKLFEIPAYSNATLQRRGTKKQCSVG